MVKWSNISVRFTGGFPRLGKIYLNVCVRRVKENHERKDLPDDKRSLYIRRIGCYPLWMILFIREGRRVTLPASGISPILSDSLFSNPLSKPQTFMDSFSFGFSDFLSRFFFPLDKFHNFLYYYFFLYYFTILFFTFVFKYIKFVFKFQLNCKKKN